MPIHLRPSAPTASDALLPGDPGRALLLAQDLLEAPRMSNHHRGLWGYHGSTPDGHPLTIQATGIGGPSAAIVLSELAGLGVRRAIRVGTCGALGPGLEFGQLVVVDQALASDGTSRSLGAEGPLQPDPTLTEELVHGAGKGATKGAVATTDLFYAEGLEDVNGWTAGGAIAVEMEAAPLFALGPRLGVAVGCVLVVSDLLDGGRRRIADEALESAALEMGRVAARALR